MQNQITHLKQIIERQSNPEQQGSLDALCGAYSAINSVEVLLNNDEFDSSEAFKVAVKAISNKFPKALWYGTFVEDVEKMVDAVCKWCKSHYKTEFQWSRPYKNRKFKTGREFVDDLCQILDDYSVAIVGISEPYEHWTVVWFSTDKVIKFFDSDGLTLVPKKAISLADGKNKWVLATEETIIIRKV